jgi:hypothetical protein
MTRAIRTAVVVVLVLATVMTVAQRFGRRGYRGWSSEPTDGVESTRQMVGQHSFETPVWTNTAGFEGDVFAFARVRYSYGGRGRGAGWETDMPDSDLNLSFRIQQMTSTKVDPDGKVVDLVDAELLDYPFIYVVEPGGFSMDEEEVVALRKYLLNGGFLMFDDFWGSSEWENCEDEMRRVFPDRSFVELSLDHPLYRCVFPISGKHQIPNRETGIYSQYTGVTWERGSDTREVHHRAIFDDAGRMMVVAYHNTDNGDGWEWEGYDNYYFRNFSEKIAYPLAINTIVYAMTH